MRPNYMTFLVHYVAPILSKALIMCKVTKSRFLNKIKQKLGFKYMCFMHDFGTITTTNMMYTILQN